MLDCVGNGFRAFDRRLPVTPHEHEDLGCPAQIYKEGHSTG